MKPSMSPCVVTAAALALAGGLSLAASGERAAPSELPHEVSAPRKPSVIAWTTGAGKWVGFWGRRELVECPPGHPQGAWGTDVYTDDSSICTAAVHAGLITAHRGGAVTIEMRPDVGQYSGTARNGVKTGDWMEPWTGAYVFVRDHTPEPAITAGSHMQADSWPGQAGRVITFACGPRFELHTVYGTDIYTDDSYVCTAAVHRGLITQKEGGMVTIKLLEGQRSFSASSRHGVTSLAQEDWKGQSYMFVATPPGTPAPPTSETPVERAPATPPAEIGAPL